MAKIETEVEDKNYGLIMQIIKSVEQGHIQAVYTDGVRSDYTEIYLEFRNEPNRTYRNKIYIINPPSY